LTAMWSGQTSPQPAKHRHRRSSVKRTLQVSLPHTHNAHSTATSNPHTTTSNQQHHGPAPCSRLPAAHRCMFKMAGGDTPPCRGNCEPKSEKATTCRFFNHNPCNVCKDLERDHYHEDGSLVA
jgi:hypothetical protein